MMDQARDAMEARASSILSWSVPTIIALGAVALHGPLAIAAVVAAVCLFLAAIACVVALWPRPWGHAGYRPQKIMYDRSLSCELESLEKIAQGYDDTASDNDLTLKRFATWLRISWVFFVGAPMFGGIGIFVSTRAGAVLGGCPLDRIPLLG